MPMSIPKIIHQTWATAHLPEPLKSYRTSWIDLHPTYQFPLYTDADNDRLVAEHYPEFATAYHGLNRTIQKVDMVRWMYLHLFGGIYVDLDVECLKSIDGLLVGDTMFQEPPSNNLNQPMLVSNYVIVMDQHSPFAYHVLQNMPHPSYGGCYRMQVCNSTGCGMLTSVYNNTPASIQPRLLDDSYFTPSSDPYGIHHYYSSWWDH